MRTENDLRAALRGLEPPVPDGAAVLRGVRRRIVRRRVLRSAGLAGVAGVAGLATLTAVVFGSGAAPGPVIAGGHRSPSRSTATQQAQTAAYIVEHAAVAEVNAARMIQVTRDRAGVSYLSVATRQTLFVSSRRLASGQPLMASAEDIKGTTFTSTLIDYQDRVYNVISASMRNGGPWGAKGIVVGGWLPGVTAKDPASAYAAALRQGIIKVLGYRTLHGHRTILIRIDTAKLRIKCQVGQGTLCHAPAGPPRPANCKVPPAVVNEVWLASSTYLEVREATLTPKTVMRMQPGKHKITWACYRVVGWSATTTEVDWLPPTKHNRALLNLTPPAGFTSVSNAQIAQYLGPYS